jgi:hypothetical protein
MESDSSETTTVLANTEPAAIAPVETKATASALTPRAVVPAACASCGAAPQAAALPTSSSCVYVIGHIQPLFPQLSIEKEARQITARAGGAIGTNEQVMAGILQDPANKYLVRQLCWVITIHGVETYILVPRDGDYQPLIDAYRAEPNPGDLELVIGTRGPLALPTMCNGLVIPIVIFDQIYAFDRQSLVTSIPKPEGADPARFEAAAASMFDQVTSQIDNAGLTPADRALNYIAVRYDAVYSLASEQFANGASLTAIDVMPSRLSGTRIVEDVVFSFTNRSTDVVSKFFTRVDVTECFPFLVTKMSPYYDR